MSIATAPQPMTEDAARRITERIRATVVHTRESIEKIQRLLTEARDGHAHVALGYDEAEWTKYMADLFADQPLRLPRDQRQALVGYLAGEGMSSRAIAPIVGATDRQVRRDIGGTNVPPAVNTETGEVSDDCLSDDATGEEVTSFTEATDTGSDPVVLADDVEEAPGVEVERSPAPSRPAVTGLDGKTYTQREQSRPRRKALTDSFWTAAYDLGKRIESVHRLTEDDRFPQNAEKVAAAHRNDLIRYRDLLEQVISQLPEA